MIYSISGVIKLAKDESEANKQIFDMQQTLICHNYDLVKDSYSLTGFFETEDIEQFMKNLNTAISLLQECKKQHNVQNN